MINDENIAAAQIAQIFGSELLKAQQSARTDSGSTPQFVKIDPKQFLAQNSVSSSQQKAQERQLIQMLQREAEAAYPLAEEPTSSAALPSLQNESPQLPTHSVDIPEHTSSLPLQKTKEAEYTIGKIETQTSLLTISTQEDVLERIALSLEKIAANLESIQLTKTTKRKRKRAVPSL